MVDYYGIGNDWPGYEAAKAVRDIRRKAEILNEATADKVATMLPHVQTPRRFIPNVSMHEIEAFYFSAPEVLARHLGIPRDRVDAVLTECGEPEGINDRSDTAPSKRLESFSTRFKKTTTGIAIAQEIGMDRMREKCPIFNAWIDRLTALRAEPT